MGRNNPFPLRLCANFLRKFVSGKFVVVRGLRNESIETTFGSKETGRRGKSEVSQLVLLRGRREIGVGVAATLYERGRSSSLVDGAADFIRPLSSTRRNICLRSSPLCRLPATFRPTFCVAAACYAVEHDALYFHVSAVHASSTPTRMRAATLSRSSRVFQRGRRPPPSRLADFIGDFIG